MSFESPVSVLYNEMGVEVTTTSGSAITSGQPGIVVLGSGSGGWDYLKFNNSGELQVAATVDVDLDHTTDSVSVYGDLDILRQEGAPGAERLMVSGAVDLDGAGFDSLILAIEDVSGALNTVNDSIGLVEISVIDVKDAVLEVSSAVENLTGGKTLLLGDSNQLIVSTHATTNVSGVVAAVENVSTEVLAARSDRQGATFFFEASASGKVCFLKFGGPAATNDFTIRMTNFSFFELPAGYGGSVEVIGNDAGAGTLYVSEWADTAY
jgi:hypothetical protein